MMIIIIFIVAMLFVTCGNTFLTHNLECPLSLNKTNQRYSKYLINNSNFLVQPEVD